MDALCFALICDLFVRCRETLGQRKGRSGSIWAASLQTSVWPIFSPFRVSRFWKVVERNWPANASS